MRKVAFIKGPSEFSKIMIYAAAEQGVYVFTYESSEEGPCDADYWFETLEEAEEYCREIGGALEWIAVHDPLGDSPHDLISG